MSTPTFAVVGAVNSGKSSIVSTLAENDGVRVSSMFGHTTDCQEFALDDLFVFYDTPGFQDPPAALKELEPARNAKEPMGVFRDFIARHHGEHHLDAECKLLKKLTEGARIIYVVDGSEPFRDINRDEMEILRLTGKRGVAVINRTSAEDHVAEWEAPLGQYFNVWKLNAQRATFEERLAFLESLASLDQSWALKIRQAVQILREDRAEKIDECAEIIVEMLRGCLTHRETSAEDSELPTRRKQLDEELKADYRRAVSETEARAHRRIIERFNHHLIGTNASADHILESGLFSEDTWRLLGLNVTQLMFWAGLAGGATGLAADALAGLHSLFLGALIGVVAGAGGALVVGKIQPELAVNVPLRSKWIPGFARRFLPEKIRQPVSGATRVVWCAALDFPSILLDRVIGTFAYASQRPHARRDRVTLSAAQLKLILNAQHASSEQVIDHAWQKIFTAIRAGKMTPAQRTDLRNKIRKWLEKISTLQIDFTAAEG